MAGLTMSCDGGHTKREFDSGAVSRRFWTKATSTKHAEFLVGRSNVVAREPQVPRELCGRAGVPYKINANRLLLP